MSTPLSEIIEHAFREGNLVEIGADITDEEIAEAVPRLNAYLSSLFGFEMGVELTDFYVPSDRVLHSPLRPYQTPDGSTPPSGRLGWQYPPPNTRLLVKSSSAGTVYLPPDPPDGARLSYVDVGSTVTLTLDGNGRFIEGEATLTGFAPNLDETPVVRSELSGRVWFYRADLANWIRLQTLTIDDTSPLPPEFDDLLVTGLCIRMAHRFGVKELDPGTVARHNDMLERAKRRYRQHAGIPSSEEFPEMFTLF